MKILECIIPESVDMSATPSKELAYWISLQICESAGDVFPKHKKMGRPRIPDQVVLEAIVHHAITGCKWKDIPKDMCNPKTANKRLHEWQRKGVWKRLHKKIINGLFEDGIITPRTISVDSTPIPARSGQKKGQRTVRKTGFKHFKASKLHAGTTQENIIVSVVIGHGRQHDSKKFEEVVREIPKHSSVEFFAEVEEIDADLAYDSSAIREFLLDQGITPGIGTKSNSRNPIPEDEAKEYENNRKCVERGFGNIKQGCDALYARRARSDTTFKGTIYAACLVQSVKKLARASYPP